MKLIWSGASDPNTGKSRVGKDTREAAKFGIFIKHAEDRGPAGYRDALKLSGLRSALEVARIADRLGMLDRAMNAVPDNQHSSMRRAAENQRKENSE